VDRYDLWLVDRVYPLAPQAKAARFAAKNVCVAGVLGWPYTPH
jgi:hypothetical protein